MQEPDPGWSPPYLKQIMSPSFKKLISCSFSSHKEKMPSSSNEPQKAEWKSI
jgi:hypothetical protein